MVFRFYCPRWGSENLGWTDFCRQVRDAGYDGVETSLPLNDRRGTEEALSALAAEGLGLIAQHWETADPDFDRHRAEYRSRMEWLAAAKPAFINSQTGRDWFSPEWNRALIAEAREVSARTSVPILHETHRGKFSFCAAVAATYLRDDPRLRISADFSHWCVVSESLLADQQASLDIAIARADHLHARVGYAEGPQVSDPRAPEWRDALEAHLVWWDRIVERRRGEGAAVFTVTPEFGPAPYMPAIPCTGEPVADQWAVNLHMMDLLRCRWAGSGMRGVGADG
jgi:sugar phosphate isomerase/epimerase